MLFEEPSDRSEVELRELRREDEYALMMGIDADLDTDALRTGHVYIPVCCQSRKAAGISSKIQNRCSTAKAPGV